MFTLKVVLLIHAILLYFVLKCRWWIVRKLVGKRQIVGNVVMKGGTFHLKPDSDALFFNSTFEGPTADGCIFKIDLSQNPKTETKP